MERTREQVWKETLERRWESGAEVLVRRCRKAARDGYIYVTGAYEYAEEDPRERRSIGDVQQR